MGKEEGETMENSQIPSVSDSDAQKIVKYRLHVKKPVLKVTVIFFKWCIKDG